MKIKQIMSEELVSLKNDDTVEIAVRKFAENKISGSPVIGEDGGIIGMLSETDILNALKLKCKRLEMVYPSLSLVSVSFIECFDDKEIMKAFSEIAGTPVSEIMTKNPITINGEMEIGEAIDLMNKKSINRIPVILEGRIAGIITRKDIIRGLADNS